MHLAAWQIFILKLALSKFNLQKQPYACHAGATSAPCGQGRGMCVKLSGSLSDSDRTLFGFGSVRVPFFLGPDPNTLSRSFFPPPVVENARSRAHPREREEMQGGGSAVGGAAAAAAAAVPTGCFKCGRPGHWSRDCPSSSASNPNPNPRSGFPTFNSKSSQNPPPSSSSAPPATKSSVKKAPRTRPKLTPELLLSEDGLGYVLRHFPRAFKYHGRGHEVKLLSCFDLEFVHLVFMP